MQQFILANPWPSILLSKALTCRSLICLCTIVNINVTKPYQTLLLIRLHVIKSTLLKCVLPQCVSTILSFNYLPVCRSPFLHLSSTSPPVLPIPLSLHSPSLPLSFSPPLSPLFLSIHTTESLLIICDLLKYIHCHSLSLPLSLALPPLPVCPVFCSATSLHYSFPLSEHFQSLLSFCSAR